MKISRSLAPGLKGLMPQDMGEIFPKDADV